MTTQARLASAVRATSQTAHLLRAGRSQGLAPLRRLVWRTALALALVPALTVPASAYLGALHRICGSYNPAQKLITLKISNRCTSAGNRYKDHDIDVSVAEDRASITVSGGFRYDPPEWPVVTRDCMGTQMLVIEVPNVAARRYSVIAGGSWTGNFDFTRSHEERCLMQPGRPHPVFLPTVAASLSDRNLIDKLLPARQGPKIQQIVEPLLRPLAVSTEGRGSLDLSISKDLGGQPPVAARAVAVIVAHGLGDDSVSGLRYTVGFAASGDGWKATHLQREQMCARGTQAGQWTHKPCP